MKKILNSILLITFLFVFADSEAQAQETVQDWPVYVVQPGDTLYLISLRFNIAMDEIIAANGIEDPNSISVGYRLELPGVDWVSGDLLSTTMPLGETLRSLTRRYQIDAETIAHLIGFVSPAQLAAGYPLMVPDTPDQDWQAARVAVGASTSLMEIAAVVNANPWGIKAANQLQGTWDIMPGDVLLLPGTNDPGPGALPSPISQITFDGDSLVQGKTAVFRVSFSGQALSLSGEILGQELHFFEYDEGHYVAMQGIHVMTNPGQYPLIIQGQSADGSSFEFNQMVQLASGGYGYGNIYVDEALLDPVLSANETAFINEIIASVTQEKYWEGIFDAPSPYAGLYNSLFGTRRSYNDSAYTYYHGGVDYQGGAGVKIYAPAPGVVVFAGPLTIRGNATVIDHGRGVYTGYWHQSEIHVTVGDQVSQGQVIGLVGNTGRSEGAHLHWELWVGGIEVEPLDWLVIEFP